MKTGERAITLEESSPRVGDSVRRMLQDRNGCYYPEPLVWQVLSVEKYGCVVALAASRGHTPHKHLIEWSTMVRRS